MNLTLGDAHVVDEIHGLEPGIAGGGRCRLAPNRAAFTVLLVVPVLRDDECRFPRTAR
jgi:hypothetical protein